MSTVAAAEDSFFLQFRVTDFSLAIQDYLTVSTQGNNIPSVILALQCWIILIWQRFLNNFAPCIFIKQRAAAGFWTMVQQYVIYC